MPLSRSSRRFIVATIAALFLAGCVERDPPGVGIQKLAADIVFGVKPAADTPPPNLDPGQAGAGDATTYVPDPGSLPTARPSAATTSPPVPGRSGPRLPRVTPVAPPKSTCPPAALTAFPAKESGQRRRGPAGRGPVPLEAGRARRPSPPCPASSCRSSGFEQRLVRNVVKVSDTEYTFETVQPELGSNVTTISTFKVKIGAVSRR